MSIIALHNNRMVGPQPPIALPRWRAMKRRSAPPIWTLRVLCRLTYLHNSFGFLYVPFNKRWNFQQYRLPFLKHILGVCLTACVGTACFELVLYSFYLSHIFRLNILSFNINISSSSWINWTSLRFSASRSNRISNNSNSSSSTSRGSSSRMRLFSFG